MKIDLAPAEKLIRDGGANLQRGWEAVGGKLFLTNTRLFFSSHAFNTQRGPAEIPLAEITSVTPCWTLFLGFLPIAPNSVSVLSDRGEHRFVVHGRAAWVSAIQSAAAGAKA